MKRQRSSAQESAVGKQRVPAHSSRPIPPLCKERLAVERMLSEGCPNTQPIAKGAAAETLRGEICSIEARLEPKADQPRAPA